MFVMRPLCLVESHSQDAAANAGMLSVYLTTIMYVKGGRLDRIGTTNKEHLAKNKNTLENL